MKKLEQTKPHIKRVLFVDGPNKAVGYQWLCRVPGKFWWGRGWTPAEAYADWKGDSRHSGREAMDKGT